MPVKKTSGAPKVPKNFPYPLANRLIITAKKPETQSAGGIIIPDTATQQQNRGYVMAVGPRVGRDTPEGYPVPKVGDLVEYGEYAFSEMDWDGVEYLIVREPDLIAIL